MHDGLRAPVSVELTERDNDAWDGRLGAGGSSVPLESVRVTGRNVHFELPGEGAFDGALEGDSIAGSVSGPLSGSFSLARIDQAGPAWTPYPVGP